MSSNILEKIPPFGVVVLEVMEVKKVKRVKRGKGVSGLASPPRPPSPPRFFDGEDEKEILTESLAFYELRQHLMGNWSSTAFEDHFGDNCI